MMLSSHRPARPRPYRIFEILPRRAFVLCVVVAFAAGCGSPEPPAANEAPPANGVQRYAIHGKIVSLDPANQAATIKHDEIVGWMDAMTMRFPIKEQADWEKLTEGAEIHGTVFVSSDGFYVGEVKVVSSENSGSKDQQQP